MQVAISSGLVERIVELAAAEPMNEVCGLLLGNADRVDSIIPAANVSANPARAFEVDAAVQFAAIRAARAGGPAVVGCYHSHPSGSTSPSDCDCTMIGRVGELWLITDAVSVRAWRANTLTSFAEVDLVGATAGCVTS
jgi:proteasome lid subunit RPN8/RPN11